MTTRCERPDTLPHPAGWNPPFDAIGLVVLSESPPPSVTSDKTDMSSFEDLRYCVMRPSLLTSTGKAQLTGYSPDPDELSRSSHWDINVVICEVRSAGVAGKARSTPVRRSAERVSTPRARRATGPAGAVAERSRLENAPQPTPPGQRAEAGTRVIRRAQGAVGAFSIVLVGRTIMPAAAQIALLGPHPRHLHSHSQPQPPWSNASSLCGISPDFTDRSGRSARSG